MKQIEAKARRVQRYDRWFFLQCFAGGTFCVAIGAAGTGWQWGPTALSAFGGVAIGAALGILLRDAP